MSEVEEDDFSWMAPKFERGTLLNGVDIFDRVIFDQEMYKADLLERTGVDLTCEWCGEIFKAWPKNATTQYACSQSCKDHAYRRRKRDGVDRPMTDMWWKPWEQRRKHGSDEQQTGPETDPRSGRGGDGSG